MPIDYELLYSFIEQLLHFQGSIRWVSIANKYGVLLAVKQRDGLKPLMTEEENEEYAVNAIKRHKTRIKFQRKIGKLKYAIGKYENINRVTIPINQDYYLLFTLDRNEQDYDDLIISKIIPFVDKYREKFQFDEE
jgi:hypothetical protein